MNTRPGGAGVQACRVHITVFSGTKLEVVACEAFVKSPGCLFPFLPSSQDPILLFHLVGSVCFWLCPTKSTTPSVVLVFGHFLITSEHLYVIDVTGFFYCFQTSCDVSVNTLTASPSGRGGRALLVEWDTFVLPFLGGLTGFDVVLRGAGCLCDLAVLLKGPLTARFLAPGAPQPPLRSTWWLPSTTCQNCAHADRASDRRLGKRDVRPPPLSGFLSNGWTVVFLVLLQSPRLHVPAPFPAPASPARLSSDGWRRPPWRR